MVQKFLNRKTYYAGDVIFREGARGDAAYLIERGAVRIFKDMHKNGGEVELGTLGPGAIFGELALIDDAPRMASAQATTETVITFVNRTMFEQKMDAADPFLRALVHILTRYTRSMGDKLSLLQQGHAPEA